MKPAVITFDAGGTLIRPHPSVGAVYAERLARHGITAAADEIEGRFRRAFVTTRAARAGPLDRACWRAIVAATLAGVTEGEKLDAIFEDLWASFAEARRWVALPGAETALAQLHDAGLRLAVFSNNDERLRGVLDGLGLGKFFEKIFVSCELGRDKPDPKAFAAVRRALDVPAAALLHAGDSWKEDYLGAQAAGWQAVLVSAKAPPTPAVRRVSRLDELPGLLA